MSQSLKSREVDGMALETARAARSRSMARRAVSTAASARRCRFTCSPRVARSSEHLHNGTEDIARSGTAHDGVRGERKPSAPPRRLRALASGAGPPRRPPPPSLDCSTRPGLAPTAQQPDRAPTSAAHPSQRRHLRLSPGSAPPPLVVKPPLRQGPARAARPPSRVHPSGFTVRPSLCAVARRGLLGGPMRPRHGHGGELHTEGPGRAPRCFRATPVRL